MFADSNLFTKRTRRETVKIAIKLQEVKRENTDLVDCHKMQLKRVS